MLKWESKEYLHWSWWWRDGLAEDHEKHTISPLTAIEMTEHNNHMTQLGNDNDIQVLVLKKYGKGPNWS